MEYSFLGFARKDCTMLFWVQKMRLGVCISVYRIGKKVPGVGGALYELLYVSTKTLKIQRFSSLCALVDYQCMTSIFNCMQLYAAHSVSCIVFFVRCVRVPIWYIQQIDIEQSIYYLREKKLKNFQESTWHALSMCYTDSVELTRMHWKTDSAERIGRTERLTVSREQGSSMNKKVESTKQLDEQKNGG